MTTNVTESKSSKTIAHTPGPWILKNHGINEPEYGHGIVHSFGGAHRFAQIENVGILETVDMDIPKLEANARLIAAAPDLLDALRMAEDALQWYDNGENKAVAQGALKEIHAALAKATQPIN